MPTHQKIFSLALFALLLLFNLIMFGDFTGDLHTRPRDGDCVNYVKMAQHTTEPVGYPFGLRLLTPLIVKIVKKNSYGLLSWDCTWYLMTSACLFVSAVLLWKLLLKVFRLKLIIANLMVVCMLGNWIYCFFQLQVPFFPDPLNNLLWTLAFYWLFERRYRAFLLTVTIGFLNKEVILFLLPLYPLGVLLAPRDRTRRPADLAWSLAGVLLVAGAYAGFRLGWTALVQADNYRLFTDGQRSPMGMLLHSISDQKDIYCVFHTFHFLWIPFLLMLWQLYRENGWRDKFILTSLCIFPALLFGRLFATDANRVFIMMLPLVLGLAGLYLQRIRLHENPPLLMVIAFIYCALNYWIDHRDWQIALNLVALLVLALQSHLATRPPADAVRAES